VISRSQLRRLATPATALLPIRIFFGATFLWAGIDKLLDPAFLDPAAPTSLHAQLVAFSRVSPLSGLIGLVLPITPVIGALIAVGEIGIGIGALSGLAFRVAAAGGAALSALLWLTASWGTHPYYLGADLPYAIGWIALLIGGPGDRYVPSRWRMPETAPAEPGAAANTTHGRRGGRDGGRRRDRGRRPPPRVEAASPERRLVLQAATLAAISAVVASLAPMLRAWGVVTGEGARAHDLGGGSPGPTTAPATRPPSTIPPGAIAVSTVAAVSSRGSASFTVPFNAPAPLPAGDPGVIVQLADGSFVAFDAVCTHAGCTVEWDRRDRLLFCPCHDAIFDAEHGAAVLDGPAPTPLASLPIVVDEASGRILLNPAG
jgi:thiosulfate dehydrogenase [quinone] large subunit